MTIVDDILEELRKGTDLRAKLTLPVKKEVKRTLNKTPESYYQT